jgi:hypothetical protein
MDRNCNRLKIVLWPAEYRSILKNMYQYTESHIGNS